MEPFKLHNRNNKDEERFNRIKSVDSTWEWKCNSIIILGGCWQESSYSGSRCTEWNYCCSNSYRVVTIRSVCRGLE
jgi:hypothetical protein